MIEAGKKEDEKENVPMKTRKKHWITIKKKEEVISSFFE
jgi:type IV pilus biogenesis protein CpaD/CtpE